MSNIRSKAVESEQALIGAAILNSEWIAQCDITADDFLRDDHKTIWRAIASLLSRREPVDFLTVVHELDANGYDGKQWTVYLSQISRSTPTAANWRGYLSALRRHGQRLKVQQILTDALEGLHQGNDVTDETITSLMSVNRKSAVYECEIKQALVGAVDHLEAVRDGKVSAISTGIEVLNQALGGWHDSDLIVVAGRPAMGKTAVLINMMLAAGVPAGLISGEQPREQIALRTMAIDGSVSIQSMRTGNFRQQDWTSIFNSVARISKKPLWLNDMPSPTLAEIQRQARAWVHRHGVKALFVDYIQKIDVPGDVKPTERVGIVTRGLKSLARELNIPVIALAQVKREVETRSCKIPTMGDISDSSEVEKEADQIMTLYRDEVYNEESQDKGIIDFNICKNRHGPTGIVRAVWRGEYMQVKDIARGAS